MTMRKITDYSEVSPTVLRYFKRGVLTNNFLTAEDYKSEIEEERLYFEEEAGNLAIFLKRDGFFILYYYILNDDVKFLEIPEKLVCDIVGDLPDNLSTSGFLKVLERVQLERESDEGIPKASHDKAGAEYAEEVYSVLKNSLNIYTGYITTISKIQKECENGLIYAVIENGQVLGVLRSGVKGKTAEIRHLAVLENHRKKGIARRLLNEFLKENADKKCIVWTGRENTAALSLYEASGFRKNKNTSTVFFKRRTKK